MTPARSLRHALALLAFLRILMPLEAAASLGDEAPIDPKLEIDPRAELDPRIDRPDPPRGPKATGHMHAPVWFAVGGSFGTLAGGVPVWGAELQIGLPLDRLSLRAPRAALAEETRASDARRKQDLTPPPPPPKLVAPVPLMPEAPLRVPVVVTSSDARAAVDAALRRAHLIDPDQRIDALATRARQSAGLPELRLRILRTADDGQTLSPVSYDPNRIVAVDTIRFWAEARATWKLDRALFAEEEVALERMRHERAEARSHLTKEVLHLLFEWQRARAHADPENSLTLSPDEKLTARLKMLETEAELDVLTDGWFVHFRMTHPEAALD